MTANLPRFYVLPAGGKYLVFDRKAPKGRWFTGIEFADRAEAEAEAAQMTREN